MVVVEKPRKEELKYNVGQDKKQLHVTVTLEATGMSPEEKAKLHLDEKQENEKWTSVVQMSEEVGNDPLQKQARVLMSLSKMYRQIAESLS